MSKQFESDRSNSPAISELAWTKLTTCPFHSHHSPNVAPISRPMLLHDVHFDDADNKDGDDDDDDSKDEGAYW